MISINKVKFYCQIVFIVNVFGVIVVFGQQDFSFGFAEAEVEEDTNKQNSENKKPIFLPGRCAPNELLYPGDHKDDWVCDCKPGYLYYPAKNSCFNAYRQGPCMNYHFLILPTHKNVPECRLNPCRFDGSVSFHNKCYLLDKSGPCLLPELSFVVGVNVTTLKIDCIMQRVQLNDRFAPDDIDDDSTDDDSPLADQFQTEYKCLKGGRRWVNDRCNGTIIE